MTEEKIVIECRQRKNLKGLATLLSGLGFTKIAYSRGFLSIEKTKGTDLRGKPYLEYKVEFRPTSISFMYGASAKKNKNAQLLDLMPTFLNILRVSEDYYDIKPTQIFSHINVVLKELSKIVDHDAIEFSTQLTELQEKHTNLNKKYADLVRSSEANTRILLECERKRDEQMRKLAQLTGMSDDLLKESLYNWIKVHGGSIDIREFSKANSVAVSRSEEGLDMLIRGGYIRRRVQ
jgi:hypothetical protein